MHGTRFRALVAMAVVIAFVSAMFAGTSGIRAEDAPTETATPTEVVTETPTPEEPTEIPTIEPTETLVPEEPTETRYDGASRDGDRNGGTRNGDRNGGCIPDGNRYSDLLACKRKRVQRAELGGDDGSRDLGSQ